MSNFRSIHRRRFDAIAITAAEELFRYFEALTDEQLAAAYEAAEDLSQTNCCWQVYKLKTLIREVASDVRFLRRPPESREEHGK